MIPRTLLLFAIYLIFHSTVVLAQSATDLTKIEALDRQLEKLDTRIISLQGALDNLEENLVQLTQKEESLHQKYASNLSRFNKTARNVLRIERMPLQALALSSSLRSAHMRQRIISQGRKSLTYKINEDRKSIIELQEIKKEKQEKLTAILNTKEDLLQKHQNLKNILDEQLSVLTQANKEEVARIRDNITERSQKISRSTKRYAARNEKQLVPEQTPERLISPYPNLPVHGEVISDYNDTDNIGLKRKGITIKTRPNATVTSLGAGTVIYSGMFRDYGYLVIIEHPDGYHSLYSGLQKSDLKSDTPIEKKASIGVMPNFSNPHLYLEIRKNGRSINPRSWLEKIS